MIKLLKACYQYANSSNIYCITNNNNAITMDKNYFLEIKLLENSINNLSI